VYVYESESESERGGERERGAPESYGLPTDEESGRLLQETEYERTGKIWAVLRLLQRQGLGCDFFYCWKTEQQRKKIHSVPHIIAAGRRGFQEVVAGDRI
jgi:hypothetical protein